MNLRPWQDWNICIRKHTEFRDNLHGNQCQGIEYTRNTDDTVVVVVVVDDHNDDNNDNDGVEDDEDDVSSELNSSWMTPVILPPPFRGVRECLFLRNFNGFGAMH